MVFPLKPPFSYGFHHLPLCQREGQIYPTYPTEIARISPRLPRPGSGCTVSVPADTDSPNGRADGIEMVDFSGDGFE